MDNNYITHDASPCRQRGKVKNKMAAVGKAWCLLRGSSWPNKLQKSKGTLSKCIRTLCGGAQSSGMLI